MRVFKINLLLTIILVSLVASCVNAQDSAEKDRAKWKSFFGKLIGAHADAYNSFSAEDGDGGGIMCVACTVIVGLVQQYAQIHIQSTEKTLDELCTFLPEKFRLSCEIAVKKFGPSIVLGFENRDTADVICLNLGACTNATCHLFPPPIHGFETRNYASEEVRDYVVPYPILESVANHLPELDLDKDYYSTSETLRGGSWRGKDCDDTNGHIYPGRKINDFPPYIDHDCNGIYGTDPLTGENFEELLCGNVSHYGIAILGDSAAAHFHIPPTYMTASEISNTTYMALVDILENEMDWPQMSTTTGYTITNWMGTPANPVSSMYLYGRKQNQCTHRDFQNIGVNGARSSSMANGIVQTLKRNPLTDHPLIVSFALIGNDVCNGHYGTQDMTTPQEFYTNVMASLNYLETKLPKGSYVVFFGLVDGRILWDTMHNRTHPIGSTNNNVNYAAVYEYLACLQISPCWGWLNPDPYWRNVTTQRANELNQVYIDIVANTTFENFEMLYFPTPLPEIIGIWGALGGDTYQLIEPIDGFHPDQRANALLAQYQWGLYLTNYTFLVPPKNPNNDAITDLFLDQGGY